MPLELGIDLGGAALGGLSMLTQRAREKRALNNQKDLMGIQFKNQQALNEQGQALQMKTWKDTNYGAQMAMMKEAGLNPALMYGQGGSGGVTGSQGGGSAASGSAPAPQQMDIGSILSASKLKAEIKLLEAEAKDKEADANKKSGVDTLEAQTRIDKLIAETVNEGVKKQLMELQADMQRIDNANRQYQIDAEIGNLTAQANKLKTENALTQAQFGDLVLEVKNRVGLQQIEMELKEANIGLTKTQIQAIKTGIQQKWTELGQDLDIAKAEIAIKTFAEEQKAEFPGLFNALGGLIKGIQRGFDKIEKDIRGDNMPDRKDRVNK